MRPYEKLQRCYDCFREKIDFHPLVGMTLGSGLGDYADGIEIAATLDYRDIEGFPVSTAEGHRGRFVFGYVEGVPVVIMQGRVHYYEGYDINDVVLPTRLMGLMGVKALFLTNASGGLNPDYGPGEFMLISDHIADFVPSPLIGPNIDELGTRFPDMTGLYSSRLREVIRGAAKDLSIPLREGVYVQLSGPNFETPAEVRMCRILGGDAVGMSTAVEAVAARHMGLEVCGVSLVTNPGAGLTPQPLSHIEVQEAADRAAPLFKKLVTASVKGIAKVIG